MAVEQAVSDTHDRQTELSSRRADLQARIQVIADDFASWDDVCVGAYERYCPKDR